MRPEYDVFEKFSDGSTLWRTCVAGQYEAERKLQELAEHSENEFVAMEIYSQRKSWVKSPYVRVSFGFLLMFTVLLLLTAFSSLLKNPFPLQL